MATDRIATALIGLAKEAQTAERDLEQAIGERDDAEEALSQAFYLVTGRAPEWSNLFGYKEALSEIDDNITRLRSSGERAAVVEECARAVESLIPKYEPEGWGHAALESAAFHIRALTSRANGG